MPFIYSGTPENGTSTSDFIFATRGQTADDTTINGLDGNDVIFGDFSSELFQLLSSTSYTFTSPFNINYSGTWTMGENSVVGNATSVPHTSVYLEGKAGDSFRYLSVFIGAGQSITVDVDFGIGAGAGTGIDTSLFLLDSGQNVLTSNYSGPSVDSGSFSPNDALLTYTASTAGTYYIAISRDGGPFLGGETLLLNVSVSGHTIGGTVQANGNDTIDGGNGDDIIYGEGGNDIITGGAGTNRLYGGNGNDVFIGGVGSDIFYGGDGTDTVSYINAGPGVSDFIDLATTGSYGLATGDAYLSIENVDASNNSDVVWGTTDNNVINGNGGNDDLYGLAGDDILNGGSGNDYFRPDAGDDTVNGGDGDDTINAQFDDAFGIDTVHGDAGNDTITGNGFGRYYGDADNDTFYVGSGAYVFDGGSGEDSLNAAASTANLTINLEDGTSNVADFIFGIENVKTGSGNDVVYGNSVANVIETGDGNDRIYGDLGADTLIGGAGTDAVFYTSDSVGVYVDLMPAGVGDGGIADGDTYDGIENVYTGSGNDLVYGSAANNIINLGGGSFNTAYGNEGDDTIVGGAGQDDLHGGVGNDYLIGGLGDDFMTGDAGTNTLQGGAGADTYYVSTNSDSTLEFAGEGIDTVYVAFNVHTLQANVENLVSNQGFSFLGIGNGLDNVITGTSARDDLYGRDGNDTLNDGGGSVGQEDTLIGGLGDDIYNVSVRGDSTIELAGEGIDTVRTAFSIYGLQANIENLTFTDNANHAAGVGNNLDNILVGGTGVDDLFGREGNDQLYGGTGSANTLLGQEGNDTYFVDAVGDSVVEFAGQGVDTVFTSLASHTLSVNVESLAYTGFATFTGIGNAGNNSIAGGGLADFLSGLDGNDTLAGFGGADTMLGGDGNDRFYYNGYETGLDRILDFASGADKIVLSSTRFVHTATVDFIQSGAPVATSTNSTFLYNVNNGIVSYDADGTGAGAAVQLAQLNAGLTLAWSDFIFG